MSAVALFVGYIVAFTGLSLGLLYGLRAVKLI
ncbi:MAG: cytochrome b6-f complex subunit PetL [Microcystaceae cyanobacterium]